jgi:hypothetical protein
MVDTGGSPTPQGGGLSFLDKLSEEDKKRLMMLGKLGQGAAAFGGQPMNMQMTPLQRGGGLLGMMAVPQMQAGQGGGSLNYGGAGADDRTGVEKLMGLLERLATAGVIG